MHGVEADRPLALAFQINRGSGWKSADAPMPSEAKYVVMT
jgi:hypothetical protein